MLFEPLSLLQDRLPSLTQQHNTPPLPPPDFYPIVNGIAPTVSPPASLSFSIPQWNMLNMFPVLSTAIPLNNEQMTGREFDQWTSQTGVMGNHWPSYSGSLYRTNETRNVEEM